jgi:hypothetical protein
VTRGDVHTVREGEAWVNRVEGAEREAGRYRRKVEAWVDGRDYALAVGVVHHVHSRSGEELRSSSPRAAR